jgi:hypothetical protein
MDEVNYFGMRDHSIFVCYKDIIKLTYPVLYHELIHNYYDDLNEFLKLDEIKDFNIFNLERLSVERLTVNPLSYIRRNNCSEETCDLLLRTFNEELTDIYTKSQFSSFGGKMYTIIPQERIKNVYIYVEEPNYQVIYDCHVHFGDYIHKIKFLTGDFIEAVKCVPVRPTCYMLNDIEYLKQLIDNKLIAYTEVLIAELGCNFELDKDQNMVLKYGINEKMMQEKIFKLGIVPIVELTDKHFVNSDYEKFMNEKDDKSTP